MKNSQIHYIRRLEQTQFSIRNYEDLNLLEETRVPLQEIKQMKYKHLNQRKQYLNHSGSYNKKNTLDSDYLNSSKLINEPLNKAGIIYPTENNRLIKVSNSRSLNQKSKNFLNRIKNVNISNFRDHQGLLLQHYLKIRVSIKLI